MVWKIMEINAKDGVMLTMITEQKNQSCVYAQMDPVRIKLNERIEK